MASLKYTQISRLNSYIMGGIYSMSVKVAAPPNFTQGQAGSLSLTKRLHILHGETGFGRSREVNFIYVFVLLLITVLKSPWLY